MFLNLLFKKKIKTIHPTTWKSKRFSEVGEFLSIYIKISIYHYFSSFKTLQGNHPLGWLSLRSEVLSKQSNQCGAGDRNRTRNLLITNQLRYLLRHTSIYSDRCRSPSLFLIQPTKNKSFATNLFTCLTRLFVICFKKW